MKTQTQRGRQRENILILDTETTLKKQKGFDIGYLIADLHGNIKLEQAFLVKETVHHKFWYEDKRELYFQRAMGEYPLEINVVKELMARIQEVISQYNIKRYYAYNASFDVRIIRNLCEEYGLPNPFENLEAHCLWDMSAETFMQTKKFREFAKANGFVTEKGNIQSSAEVAYAYLNNIPHFEEEHTSLEDCKIEYQIFLEARKRKRIKLSGQTWKKVQEPQQ